MISEENRFSLIDEPWIPVVDEGKVGLRQLFSSFGYRSLGGNPIQKIALTKLLLAIAQAAKTPEDEEDWENLEPEGLSQACLDYLDRWQDRFFLFGTNPFLQMKTIERASLQSFGAALPEVSTGNTTILNQSQVEKELTDADKALLIVQLMGFALGGKKTDNSVVLSPDYNGKTNEKGNPSTSRPGPFVGYLGYLHSFMQGQSILESLWLNLFTRRQIIDLGIFPSGIGVPPWEEMPEGEDCPVAKSLISSLMGTLVPISRFCLLDGGSFHYSEGIFFPGYKEGGRNPSVAVDSSGKVPRVLWVDPAKRPWRLLPALLNFMSQSNSKGFECYQVSLNMKRALRRLDSIGVWSGGLRVSNNAGEQYVSGSDDFLESLVQIKSESFGEDWYNNLKLEMEALENLSKIIFASVLQYFKDQKMKGTGMAGQSSNLFWQLCERRFQDLVDHSGDQGSIQKLRFEFAKFAFKVYDLSCPNETARQIDAWAHHRPALHWYMSFEKERR